MTDDATFLAQAVDLATANVAAGGGPFGALVARDGLVVATGVNRVTRDLDPSAHAEVTAIREAARAIGDFSLAGCALYTSCEPCPMCLATSLWARLDRVVFAADRHDAAKGGFDDLAFYDLFGTGDTGAEHWPTRVIELRLDNAFAPFAAWLSKDDRTAY
ncbi:MAG: nucleoside deaminase [Nocardioides sp.]